MRILLLVKVPYPVARELETVKGTNFVNLRSAGDPVELGKASKLLHRKP